MKSILRQFSLFNPLSSTLNGDLDLHKRIEVLKSEISNKGFNADKVAKHILSIIEDKITLVEMGCSLPTFDTSPLASAKKIGLGAEERSDKALNTLLLMLKTLCSRNITSSNSIFLYFILDALKTPYILNAINKNNVLMPLRAYGRSSAPTKQEPGLRSVSNSQSMDWTSLPKLPLNQGGTYLFTQKLDKGTYIGSALSFEERMLQHKRQFRGALKVYSKSARALHKLEHLRQDTLTLNLIHIIPNYFKLFKLDNPDYVLSRGESDILLNLTFYPVRVLEQNLISTFKPSINGYYGKYYTKVIHRFNS
jgi:hypothetical protein